MVAVIGEQKDVVLARLGVIDVAVLVAATGSIAAVDHVAARKLIACSVDVAERSPAIEVDVVSWVTVNQDVQIPRLVDLHVIESGVGGSVKTAGTCTIGSCKT